MPLKIWPGLKYVLSPKSAAFSTPSSPFVVSRKFSGLMSLRCAGHAVGAASLHPAKAGSSASDSQLRLHCWN